MTKNGLTKNIFSIFAFAAFLFCLSLVSAKAKNSDDPNKPTKNIVETASAAGNFTILQKALAETGLLETLKSGNYTVFAPNDAAFNKLPPQALEILMADKEGLKRILLYHVVEGKMMAADVAKQSELKTMQGSKAPIKVKDDGKVKIDGSRILQTDILATNGVIHVIDTVITPN
jgi:uncharacterized surface protein with fasciclin (FAS1) repeats